MVAFRHLIKIPISINVSSFDTGGVTDHEAERYLDVFSRREAHWAEVP